MGPANSEIARGVGRPRRISPGCAARAERWRTYCACRFGLSAMLLLLWISPAGPAATQEASAAAAAKSAAFQALGERYRAALDNAIPAGRRLSVYLNWDLGGLAPTRVDVAVDGKVREAHRYSDGARDAFREKGFHRILRAAAAPGRHRMVVRATGMRPGASDDDAYKGVVEAGFDMPAKPHALVIPVSALRPANRGWYQVRPYGWRVEGPDPAVRMARFLRHTGDPYAAMIELFGLAVERGPAALETAGARIELAFGYVAFGMPDHAREQLDAVTGGDPYLDRLPDLRIALARLYLARGEAGAALAVLGASPDRADRKLFWIDVKSRALMASGRQRQAAELLEGADRFAATVDDDAFRHYPEVFRFNRGVALVRGNAADEGRHILGRLGQLTGKDPSSRRLRDRANLALGFDLLRNGQPEAAYRVLGRLSGAGYAEARAGLARGWAALGKRGSGATGMTALEAAPSADLKRALKVWSAVAGRAVDWPAVQEAMVLTAFAHHQLGHADQATTAFRRALDALERRQAQLDERMAEVRRQARGAKVCTGSDRNGDQVAVGFWDLSALASATRDYRQMCGLYALLAGPAERLLSSTCGRAGSYGARPSVTVDLRPWIACDGINDMAAVLPRVATGRAGAKSALAAVRAQRALVADLRLDSLAAERERTGRYLEMAVEGALANYERALR